MGRKEKTFQETKIPRYLPCSVARHVWFQDLREYNKHRRNVFYANKRIDNDPPKLNPRNCIKKSMLAADHSRIQQIERENRAMIIKINIINRTKGFVDSFNPIAYAGNHARTNWRAHELDMKRIQRQNKEFYRRLTSVESNYSRRDMKQFWNVALTKMKHTCKFPLLILKKEPTLDDRIRAEPSISQGLEQTAERPYCFLEFSIKDCVYLGKVIIELYHDHVPVTVQNFLSICKGENNLSYKNCPIHNIVQGLCIETGDITKGNGKGGTSIYGETFDEENYVLRHTRPGVLSMIKVKGSENNSQFSITLTKAEKLDGKRVVFGQVVKGNSALFAIQGLQKRKVGKPSIPVIISNCGEYKLPAIKRKSKRKF